MKRTIILSALVLFVSAVASVRVAFGRQDYNIVDSKLIQRYKLASASYDRAKGSFLKQDYVRALKELDACLDRMPELSDAHFLMAKILYTQKDYAKALEHIEKAKASFDFTAKIVIKLQQDRLLELQRMRDNQITYINALKDDLARAVSTEARRKIEKDIQEAERVKANIESRLVNPMPDIDRTPAEYHFFHGNILFRQKKLPEAEAQYLEALKIDSLHIETTNNLASLYYGIGQFDKALATLSQAEARGVAVNTDLKKAVLKALGR